MQPGSEHGGALRKLLLNRELFGSMMLRWDYQKPTGVDDSLSSSKNAKLVREKVDGK
jgi:hypothetical protein